MFKIWGKNLLENICSAYFELHFIVSLLFIEQCIYCTGLLGCIKKGLGCGQYRNDNAEAILRYFYYPISALA